MGHLETYFFRSNLVLIRGYQMRQIVAISIRESVIDEIDKLRQNSDLSRSRIIEQVLEERLQNKGICPEA